MSGETFSDATMLEIFRAEVDAHVESLTNGLLAVEREPGDMSHLDVMMRGAHSIKGAARIVGIDSAVRVAHALEDGFVAAQSGKIRIRPDHIDVLLQGVDFLNRVAHISSQSSIDWKPFDAEAVALTRELSKVLDSPREIPDTAVQEGSRSRVPEAEIPEQSHRSGGELQIELPVFFDAAEAEKARVTLIKGVDAAAELIRLDLTRTTDIDAVALAFLAAIPAQYSTGRTRVELSGASADLQLVLEMTGIDRLYPTGGHSQS